MRFCDLGVCGGALLLQMRPQTPIIFRLLLRLQQTDLGGGNLIEQLLGNGAELSRLKTLDLRHTAIGRIGDHVGIRLEKFDSQQTIGMGRLIGLGDS